MRLSFDRKVAGHFAEPGLNALIAPRSMVWIQLILATAAVLWTGWSFFRRGWATLVNRRLNRFTLIALGTGVAYFSSLVAALAPGIFPRSFRTPEGEVALYFEAAAVFIARSIWGPPPAMGFALVNTVAVLIIPCPCASVSRRRCRSWLAPGAAYTPGPRRERRGARVDGSTRSSSARPGL